jgi:hypothetical protein
MIMHWPSFTAMMEPLLMILSSPLVLELRSLLLIRFMPFMTRTSGPIPSQ